MIATSKIEIDLNWYTRHKIEATQDDKYSRDVQITLVADSVPWEIPDGVTAVVNYVKPDGTGGEYDTMPNGETAWSTSGNVLTVKLAPQVLTVAGTVQMGVTLIMEHKEINTFQIAIDVHKNVANMLTKSEDYFNPEGDTGGGSIGALTGWEIVQSSDTVTLNYTLEDGSEHTDVITFDESGYPVSITHNGVTAEGTWTEG